jgi:hypothetical protein
MGPPRRDVLGETQKFAAMRDALRRAVGPDTRSAGRSPRSPGGFSVTGSVLHCPVHGVVTGAGDTTTCPVDVLVGDDHGALEPRACGRPLLSD